MAGLICGRGSMTTTQPDSLSLREAAERLSVHYMTVYRYVRLGILPARKVGGTWRIAPADLARVSASQATIPDRRADRSPRRRAPWIERLRARMLAGDEAGSWKVIEAAMASGMEPADIYVDLLGPSLHAIGSAWQTGDIGIEQEHLASSVAAAMIGRLGPRFHRRGRRRGSVVMAMPSGERHGLGVAMVADILSGDGFDVLN